MGVVCLGCLGFVWGAAGRKQVGSHCGSLGVTAITVQPGKLQIDSELQRRC